MKKKKKKNYVAVISTINTEFREKVKENDAKKKNMSTVLRE